MTAPAPTVSPELGALLRRMKLGKLLDTLPERLALARTNEFSHGEFLELVLADEVIRRDTSSASLRARNAGLDPSMTMDRWDPSTAVTYDQATWAAGIHRRRRGGCTRRDHRAELNDDLVGRQSTPRPLIGCGSWTSPSTPPPAGRVYLAVVLDAFSRRVVRWSIADHIRTELVIDAVQIREMTGEGLGEALP